MSENADFSIDNGDRSISRLAPVSLRAGVELTEVFAELTQSWKKYTEMEEGDKIGMIIKDLSVEEQLERLEHMPKVDMMNVVRFHLRKMTTVQEENEMLVTRNRDLSGQIHLLEHRILKAQTGIFDKMRTSVREIVDNFHSRELELARQNEQFSLENAQFSEENSNLSSKLEDVSRKYENIVEEHRKKEELFEKLAEKFDEQSEKIFELRESLENAKKTAKNKNDEAVQEALDAQNLRIMLVKQKDEIWEQARRHEEALKNDMDEYRSNLEQQISQIRRKCKEELETIRNEKSQLEAQLVKRNAEVERFEKHFEMMEAQIKGNMKRSLAVNYQEMLNIISAGPSHVPSPPSDNPLLDLARDLETANKENEKKRALTDRSTGPPSPKRNVGVQARPEKEKEAPRVVRKAMPPSFGRNPSSMFRK